MILAIAAWIAVAVHLNDSYFKGDLITIPILVVVGLLVFLFFNLKGKKGKKGGGRPPIGGGRSNRSSRSLSNSGDGGENKEGSDNNRGNKGNSGNNNSSRKQGGNDSSGQQGGNGDSNIDNSSSRSLSNLGDGGRNKGGSGNSSVNKGGRGNSSGKRGGNGNKRGGRRIGIGRTTSERIEDLEAKWKKKKDDVVIAKGRRDKLQGIAKQKEQESEDARKQAESEKKALENKEVIVTEARKKLRRLEDAYVDELKAAGFEDNKNPNTKGGLNIQEKLLALKKLEDDDIKDAIRNATDSEQTVKKLLGSNKLDGVTTDGNLDYKKVIARVKDKIINLREVDVLDFAINLNVQDSLLTKRLKKPTKSQELLDQIDLVKRLTAELNKLRQRKNAAVKDAETKARLARKAEEAYQGAISQVGLSAEIAANAETAYNAALADQATTATAGDNATKATTGDKATSGGKGSSASGAGGATSAGGAGS